MSIGENIVACLICLAIGFIIGAYSTTCSFIKKNDELYRKAGIEMIREHEFVTDGIVVSNWAEIIWLDDNKGH